VGAVGEPFLRKGVALEKYGVDVEQRQEKEASATAPACPRCGRERASAEDVNVPTCPECGTEPFEVP